MSPKEDVIRKVVFYLKSLDLGNEKIGKLLLNFSIPCIISMLVGALYNIVDQIFIGNGVGYLGNAATNVVYPFTVIALALALLIGDGASAIFSLYLGKKDNESANKGVGNSLVLMVIISIIVTLFGFLFQEQILKVFGVTSGTYSYAKDYYQVILIGIPFYILTSGLNGIVRADGAPKFAMFATLLGAILNIILDPIAIFVFHLGVKGAAIATIFGQIMSCIVTLLYFIKPKKVKLTRDSFKLDKGICKKITMLGVSSFITQISIVIVIAVANNMIVKYGALSKFGSDIPLSVVGIVMKVFAIVIAIVIGITIGSQPIIGYNFGAGKIDRVKKTFKLILITNTIIGIIAFILFQVFPQYIINIFGSESNLYNEYALLCFRIYLAGIIFTCITKCCSIYLQSIGKPIKSMILSLSRDIVIFIPALIILAHYYGVVGMLWSSLIADVVSFLLAIIVLRNHNKSEQEEKVASEEKVVANVKSLPKNMVITIAREYGSGGRYVGELLAKELNMKFYDKELIRLASKKSGLSEEYIQSNDQIKNSYNSYYNNDDEIFLAESEVIKNISKEPCVIIGRCVDYILKDKKNVFKIFLYSDEDSKIRRCVKYYGLSKKDALKKIKNVDKDRAKHYEYYTNRQWMDFDNYDLAIHVDKLGVQGTVNVIKNLIENKD